MTDFLYDADHLYALLPEVYRQRDGKDQPGGRPLYDLVELLAREARVLARDIGRLHENSFVETADEWALPYIGDLLGVEGLRAGRKTSARAEVANTLGYRRRKGTAAVLEQLAFDVTGWPARVVEAFALLAWSQYVPTHIRPGAIAWADLRSAARLELVDGPLDTLAHTVDVRRAAPREGRHNLPNVLLFLCRLEASPQLLTTPFEVGSGQGRFTFSPLGHDAPLFTHPHPETGIAGIAEERHLPLPIRRHALHDDLEKGKGIYLGTTPSIVLWQIDASDPLRPRWRPLDADYRACNLEDWTRPLPLPNVKPVVGIDPALGRLRFADPTAVPKNFRVSSFYGFAGHVGGGQYDRSPLTSTDGIVAAQRLQVGDPADPLLIQRDDVDKTRLIDQLETALQQPWAAADGHRLIEIVDSRTYEVNLAKVEIPAGCRLILRAEDRQRPTLRLGQELQFTGGAEAKLHLDGLLVTGAGLRIGSLEKLELRHTTLVPGLGLEPDGGPQTPGAVSLTLTSGATEASFERVLLGGVRTAPETTCRFTDCGIDVHNETQLAYGGLPVTDSEAWGGPLHLAGVTVFGGIRASAIVLAENSLLLGPAFAERRQQGCVRFCWVPLLSRVPRRFHCQPDPPEGSSPETAKSLEIALRPRFTSRRYGQPGYAQLDWRGPQEILRGGDDGSEMGVFHHLEGVLREDDLRRRLDEYLPAALEAGIFYST